MKRWILFTLTIFALVFAAACDNFNLFSPNAIQADNAPVPVASPSPSPSPSPGPTASPDPCKAPVTGINFNGPTSVAIGSVFAIDVTPVNASGPLEGALDYCNNGRVPHVESMSANLRCSGECSGYKPQFAAIGVGPFEIRIRVDAASEVFAGNVTR